jgi:Zn-dependent protease with chaperone function
LGRGLLLQGRDAPAQPDVKGAGRRSLHALGLLALGCLALINLHAAAAGQPWPSPWPVVHSMINGLPILLLAPYVMVLFSRGKRVLTGQLFDTVKELAAKAGLPMPRVYMAQWTKPNAFATGFLHRLAIVAAAGPIMELLTPREMRAVMSHELSHVKYYHMLYFVPALFFLQFLPQHAANVIQLMVVTWAVLAWTFLFSALSRANELQADHGGAALSKDPAALASALRKLSIYGSLKSGVPVGTGNGVYNALLSHPSIPERLKYLDEMSPKN